MCLSVSIRFNMNPTNEISYEGFRFLQAGKSERKITEIFCIYNLRTRFTVSFWHQLHFNYTVLRTIGFIIPFWIEEVIDAVPEN